MAAAQALSWAASRNPPGPSSKEAKFTCSLQQLSSENLKKWLGKLRQGTLRKASWASLSSSLLSKMARSNVAMDGTSRSNSSEHCPTEEVDMLRVNGNFGDSGLACTWKSGLILRTIAKSNFWWCVGSFFSSLLGQKKAYSPKWPYDFQKHSKLIGVPKCQVPPKPVGCKKELSLCQSTGVIWGQRKWKLVQTRSHLLTGMVSLYAQLWWPGAGRDFAYWWRFFNIKKIEAQKNWSWVTQWSLESGTSPFLQMASNSKITYWRASYALKCLAGAVFQEISLRCLTRATMFLSPLLKPLCKACSSAETVTVSKTFTRSLALKSMARAKKVHTLEHSI